MAESEKGPLYRPVNAGDAEGTAIAVGGGGGITFEKETEMSPPRPTDTKLWDKNVIIELIVGVIVLSAIMFGACLAYNNIHRPAPNNTGKLDQLGSFIGGVSLFLTVLIIWYEANLIRKRKDDADRLAAATNTFRVRQADATNTFRVLYQEFWKEPEVSEIRRMIISTDEYEKKLKQILVERNKTGAINNLCADQNKVLDQVDRFLSVLVRFRSFYVSEEFNYIDKTQRKLLAKLIDKDYFIKDIIGQRRSGLMKYIDDHWKGELVDPIS
jgi:hypothetical protein